MARDAALLTLKGLTVQFGGLVAVDKLDLTVGRGEILSIIGPNGAGKTTVFNCISGLLQPSGGRIQFSGEEIAGRTPHAITSSGIARTFQSIRLFPNMTAVDNVMVGADANHRTSVPGALIRSPRHRREEREGLDDTHRLLRFTGIEKRGGELARNLAYGDQRRLEIARAMATRPRLLLLDEPAAGMNQSEKQALMSLIVKIRESGLTILLIDHDMKVVMGISDRIAVLNFGRKIADGRAQEVQGNPEVIAAYLGEPGDAA